MNGEDSKPLVIFDGPQFGELLKAVRSSTETPIESYKLRLQAEELALSPGFDQLLSLDRNNIDEYPHQIRAASSALRRMRGRALLADEVGLGKTIEAGIVMKELMIRGLARKILVLVPASLCLQWQEEMAEKFDEQFVINTEVDGWEENDCVIASIDQAKQPAHARKITSINYDLVIVDEAHKLKNRSSVAWKLVNSIRRKYILLLTATPVHNDLSELYSLVTLIQPGLLRTYRAFRKHFVNPTDPRRPLDIPALKGLLANVMIRNRRSSVEVKFPPRTAYTYSVNFSREEEALYSEVTRFLREGAASSNDMMTLILLQQEICSSALAAKHTLDEMGRKPIPDHPRPELLRLSDMAGSISRSSKAEAVVDIVREAKDKVIVFTSFSSTKDLICKRLVEDGVDVVEFHGGMTPKQKDDAVKRFRAEGQVFVSTESGSEGRNLQFCNIMVNYDLPWNPMLIEQRIGRIHRLGQQREVYIFNLAAKGTIEQYILELLADKIRMFELVVGELDLILGSLETKDTFEGVLRKVALEAADERDVRRRLGDFGKELETARQRFAKIKQAEVIVSKIFE